MMTSSSIDTGALMQAFAAATPQDRQTLAETLAREAALAAIFDQPPLLIGGCSIYPIAESWHLGEALRDDRFETVQTVQELESFLATQDAQAAIVTRSCGLSLAQLEAMLGSGPYIKTVLWDDTGR